jgi:hypothetical protein
LEPKPFQGPNIQVRKKKKQKPNKPWYDDECKVKLRHINSLGRHLSFAKVTMGQRAKVKSLC